MISNHLTSQCWSVSDHVHCYIMEGWAAGGYVRKCVWVISSHNTWQFSLVERKWQQVDSVPPSIVPVRVCLFETRPSNRVELLAIKFIFLIVSSVCVCLSRLGLSSKWFVGKSSATKSCFLHSLRSHYWCFLIRRESNTAPRSDTTDIHPVTTTKRVALSRVLSDWNRDEEEEQSSVWSFGFWPLKSSHNKNRKKETNFLFVNRFTGHTHTHSLTSISALKNFFAFQHKMSSQPCSRLTRSCVVLIAWLTLTNAFSIVKAIEKLEDLIFGRQVQHEPDLHFTTDQMIRFRGFECETHYVTTSDCYVLAMHRIVVPANEPPDKYRPVLIQHGLLGSSADFVINSVGGRIDDDDNRNLAFYLAKNGFDVWMGNVRGNYYSRNHTEYNPDKGELMLMIFWSNLIKSDRIWSNQFPETNRNSDKNFWRFSFDEHALEDLPALVGHVQKMTNSSEISYVGFSQGTLTMFELLSMESQVNQMVKPFIALAPVTKVTHTKSPLKYLAYNNMLVHSFIKHPGQYLDESHWNEIMAQLICRGPDKYLCENLVFLLVGYDSIQFNTSRLPVYLEHMPAGTSKWNLAHYAQMIRDDRLQMMDFGSNGNVRCYGMRRPPEIFLNQITSQDIHLFFGDNDWLADPKDVDFLRASVKGRATGKKRLIGWLRSRANCQIIIIGLRIGKSLQEMMLKLKMWTRPELGHRATKATAKLIADAAIIEPVSGNKFFDQVSQPANQPINQIRWNWSQFDYETNFLFLLSNQCIWLSITFLSPSGIIWVSESRSDRLTFATFSKINLNAGAVRPVAGPGKQQNAMKKERVELLKCFESGTA